MNNLLLERIAYQEQRPALGAWRRDMYPSGAIFAEFRSHRTLLGWPLLHYTKGVCPETGRRVTARGVIAIGWLAVGMIALGQAAIGLIAIGQLALGWSVTRRDLEALVFFRSSPVRRP